METARRIDRWTLGVLFATAGMMAGAAGGAAAFMAAAPGVPSEAATTGVAAAPASGARGFCSAPFADGERLRYKVRWGPIRLATLTITQERAAGRILSLRRQNVGRDPARPCRSSISSSRIGPSFVRKTQPRAISTFETGRRPVKERIAYRYDGVAGEVAIEQNDENGPGTRQLPPPGSALRRRWHLHADPMPLRLAASVSVPTIVDQEIRPTRLTFTTR